MQGGDEFGVIGEIIGADPGVTRGTNAGRAAQGVDLETGIVGEHGAVRQRLRVTRLQQGILTEARARLFG